MAAETLQAGVGMSTKPHLRIAVLLGLLGLSLVALFYKTQLQVWLYGVDRDLKPLLGHVAPELPKEVRTLAGEPFQLASLRGKAVLLHFWTYG